MNFALPSDLRLLARLPAGATLREGDSISHRIDRIR
jgi:hypothetical protein